jgi:hypothetical protein
LIIEYECEQGHLTEKLRKYADRDLPTDCEMCGLATTRIEISAPHIEPDGLYSHCPNLGSARDFERRQDAKDKGQRVIKRTFDDHL